MDGVLRPSPQPKWPLPLQARLREAGQPNHFSIHSFQAGGSLNIYLAGTAVYKIIKIDGWKSEAIEKYCTGATSSGRVRGGKRKSDQIYTNGSRLPLSPEFEKDFAPFSRKGSGMRKENRVQELRIRPVAHEDHKEKYYPTTRRSMGKTTGRRRRPHPLIQHLHSMIQDIETSHYRNALG